MRLKSRITISVVLLFLCIQMNAQTCSSFGATLKTAWEEVYTIAHPIGEDALTLIPVVGENEDAIDAISDASARLHDFVFDENRQSWATIGIRDLPVLDERIKQYGTLVKAGIGGVRTFNTTGQLWDRVEIEIKKEDFKAETEVIICWWDLKSGAKNNYDEFTFPAGESTIGMTKKWVIRNAHGKSISVKLRNRSAANRFKYSISTQGFLNINKQRNRAGAETNTQKGTLKAINKKG